MYPFILCGGVVASWLLRLTLDQALWVQVLAGDLVYIHGQIKKILLNKYLFSRKE